MSTPTGKKRGRKPKDHAASAASSSADSRSLRQKGSSSTVSYLDGLESDSDEETHYRQTFDVQEKLESAKFPQYFVREMRGDEVTIAYFQRSGFATPILVKEKTGLQMTVPDSSFTVTDVKNAVGARRTLEVGK